MSGRDVLSTFGRNADGPLTRRMIGEETLGALHAVVAILLFKEGWNVLAWVFVARAIMDEASALVFAFRARRDGPDTARNPGAGQ